MPIVFQPTGVKRRPAALMIISNAANDNGVQSVTLVGFGMQGSLAINPGSLSFPVGDVISGPASASKSVTLSNRNPLQLTISGISSSNPEVFPAHQQLPFQATAECPVHPQRELRT